MGNITQRIKTGRRPAPRGLAGKVSVSFVACQIITALNTAVAYAETDAFAEAVITNGLGQIYSILSAVILPIGAIALAVCALKMVYGDEKSTENAKGALVRIIIAVILIYLAPLIINTVVGLFRGRQVSLYR